MTRRPRTGGWRGCVRRLRHGLALAGWAGESVGGPGGPHGLAALLRLL